MTPVIRPAEIGDTEAIADIHVRAWQAAYRTLLPAEVLAGLDRAARATRWREQLANPGTAENIFVAADPAIVGFISVGPARESAGFGELRAIYLDPARIGRGIGAALHDSGLAALRRSGFARILLWVATGNDRARSFYLRHGWSPTGDSVVRAILGCEIAVQRYERALPAHSAC